MEPNPETGGAIRLFDANDTLIIDRSVISSSEANGGGAIFVGGGVTLQVVDSALIDNEANFSGSAILAAGSTDVTIVNSTVSGNESLNNFGAIFQQTAGSSDVATMLLRNVTVANNTGVGVQSVPNSGISNISIGNSLIAENTASNLGSGGLGTTTFTSLGNNLLDSLDIAFSVPSDQIDPAPLIGTLANNGGPTPTHALLTGSPAINEGSNALALDADGDPLLTDQRGAGFARIIGGTVDIGAFESQTLVPSADFDNDGDVDGADFLAWQRGFGTASPTPAEGDADFDGDVDATDLGIWQANFGSPSTVVAAATSGPSPAARAELPVARAELIDAAIFREALGNQADEQAPFADASLLSEPVWLPSNINTADSYVSKDAVTTSKASKIIVEQAEDFADAPWLSDELLEQVFG